MIGAASAAWVLGEIARLRDEAGWFARVGVPLDGAERSLVDALTATMPVAGRVEVVVVADWAAAHAFDIAADAEGVDWAAAETLRDEAWAVASARWGEAGVARALEVVAAEVDAAIAAADLRTAAPAATPAATAAAWRAARLAAHDAALAELAGADGDHPARARFALYARGRWVVGYHAGRYGIA